MELLLVFIVAQLGEQLIVACPAMSKGPFCPLIDKGSTCSNTTPKPARNMQMEAQGRPSRKNSTQSASAWPILWANSASNGPFTVPASACIAGLALLSHSSHNPLRLPRQPQCTHKGAYTCELIPHLYPQLLNFANNSLALADHLSICALIAPPVHMPTNTLSPWMQPQGA